MSVDRAAPTAGAEVAFPLTRRERRASERAVSDAQSGDIAAPARQLTRRELRAAEREADALAEHTRATDVTAPQDPVPPAVKTLKGEAGRWLPAGETTDVAGLVIHGGMIYVGTGLTAPKGGPEPSLIDPTLDVNRSPNAIAVPLGYWPSYSSISPASRAGYLGWLANGRRAPKTPLGFVFLFMYGLERRVLVDGVTDPGELARIAREMRALRDAYAGASASFRAYATSFIDLLDLMMLQSGMSTDPLDLELPAASAGVPFAARVFVGRLAAASKPVPAEVAFAWMWASPEIPLRTTANRCTPEFASLFAILYRDNHGAGMVVEASDEAVTLVYRPASAGIGTTRATLKGIPDVIDSTEALLSLLEISTEAQSLLDGYSRHVGKNPGSQGTLDAISRLPVQLIGLEAEATSELARWAEEAADQGETPQGAELFQRWGFPYSRHRLTKPESVAIAKVLGELGIGIEPDVRFGGEPFVSGRNIVLFRQSTSAPRAASTEYEAAQLLVHLAVAVSASDGRIVDVETSTLMEHIEMALGLSNDERSRLQAHAKWCASVTIKGAGLASRVTGLTREQRDSLADLLLRVAASDGVLAPEETAMLTKIFAFLGEDASAVSQRVNAQIGTAYGVGQGQSNDDEPSVVWRAPPAVHGQVIPRRPVSVPAEYRPTNSPMAFMLDHRAIESTLRSTALVSALLRDVFIDEPEAVAVQRGSSGPVYAGLDAAHSQLLGELATRPELSRIEFDDLARGFDLLPDGAIDTLNEAALDTADEPLIEGDDTLVVSLDVLQEMMK